ncbi:hypothetical protein [Pseudonocardia lacus]|uniref:hypothetical protein n=1 Tax=Pseudonocardia lacus TaxID=2835865 RepID=UPI001BDBE8DA|nr:hypothetical protein [Pseudonocardia lacus]
MPGGTTPPAALPRTGARAGRALVGGGAALLFGGLLAAMGGDPVAVPLVVAAAIGVVAGAKLRRVHTPVQARGPPAERVRQLAAAVTVIALAGGPLAAMASGFGSPADAATAGAVTRAEDLTEVSTSAVATGARPVLEFGLELAAWDWAVAGGAMVVATGIAVVVRTVRARLAQARLRVLAGWAAVPPAVLPLPGQPVRADDAVRLLVGAVVHLGRPEFTAAELLTALRSEDGAPDWLAALSARLAGDGSDPTRAQALDAVLAELVAAGLFAVSPRQVGAPTYRLGDLLTDLRARAPPAYVDALLRNPAELVGAAIGDGRAESVARAVTAGLRTAIWDRRVDPRRWRALVPRPLRAARLRSRLHPLRVQGALVVALEQAVAEEMAGESAAVSAAAEPEAAAPESDVVKTAGQARDAFTRAGAAEADRAAAEGITARQFARAFGPVLRDRLLDRWLWGAQGKALHLLRRMADAPSGHAQRTAVLAAMRFAAGAGVPAARVARIVGLPVEAVELHRTEPAGDPGPERTRIETAVAALFDGMLAEPASVQDRLGQLRSLFVEAVALAGGWSTGLERLHAGAAALHWELRWQADGEVQVVGRLGDGPEGTFVVAADAVARAGNWLSDRRGEQVPEEQRLAEAAGSWGTLVAGRVEPSQVPVVAALNAMAALQTADPRTAAAVAELATELLSQVTPDAAQRKTLSAAGDALFEQALPEARRAADQRAALLADPGARVAALLADVAQWTDAAVPATEGSPVARMRAAVAAAVAELARAEEALIALIAAKRAALVATDTDLRRNSEDLERVRTHEDRGAEEAEREVEVERGLILDNQRLLAAVIVAVHDARTAAQTSRAAYEQLGRLLDGALAAGALEVAGLAAVRSVLAEVQAAVRAYESALEATAPPRTVLPGAVPTGELPDLPGLTDQVNTLLAQQGLGYRYTRAMLDSRVRGNVPAATGPDGFVLTVPARRSTRRGLPRSGRQPAELRFVWRPTRMVEVTDPEARAGRVAAELMQGSMAQGGGTIGAAATSSVRNSVSVTADVGALPAFIAAHPTAAALLEWGTARANLARQWTSARTRSAAAGNAALGGGVTDNRGPSVLVEVAGGWEVQVRTGTGTGGDRGWVGLAEPRRAGRRRGDPAGAAPAEPARMWVSQAYSARAPPEPQPGVPPEADVEFPPAAPVWVGGLEELVDRVAATLDRAHAATMRGTDTAIGGVTRRQLRAQLVGELASRLDVAVNDDRGLRLPITDRFGRPLAELEVHAQPDRDTAELVGRTVRKELLEDLHVWFSTLSSSLNQVESHGGAFTLTLAPLRKLLAAIGLPERVGPALSWTRTRLRARTGGRASSQVTIRPGVHRESGWTSAYLMDWTYSVTVRTYDDRVHEPVTATAQALLRMGELNAHGYGLPIERAALRAGESAPERLRGQLDPAPPPGRQGAPPSWLGSGPGQLQVIGQSLVRDIPWTFVREVRTKVLEQLRAEGLIPPIDPPRKDGRPADEARDDDRTVLATQHANQREVLALLSPERWQTGHDQAVHGGLVITLEDVAPRRRLPGVQQREQVEIVLTLVPDWGHSDSGYVGFTAAWTTVGLDIQSNTSSLSSGESWNRSSSYEIGTGLALDADVDQAKAGVQAETTASLTASGRRGRSRSAGMSVGTTVNAVKLIEGMGSTAGFQVRYRAAVALRRFRGTPTVLADGEFTASVMMAADLLPDARPYPRVAQQELPGWARDRMVPLAMQASGMYDTVLDAVRQQLPLGFDLDLSVERQLREWTNIDRLRASLSDLLDAGLRTSVRARGPDGEAAWFDVRLDGTTGTTEFITVADLLTADINLTLNSLGSDQGQGWSVGGRGGVGLGLDGVTDPHRVGGGGGYGQDFGHGWNDLAIWGREFLGIELGKHHIGRLGVDLRVSVEGGEARPVAAEVVYALPERDVLDHYAFDEEGVRGSVPVEAIGEAVERVLQGEKSLLLDLRTAGAVVERFWSEWEAADAERMREAADRLRTAATPERPQGPATAAQPRKVPTVEQRDRDRMRLRLNRYLRAQLTAELARRNPGKDPYAAEVLRGNGAPLPAREDLSVAARERLARRNPGGVPDLRSWTFATVRDRVGRLTAREPRVVAPELLRHGMSESSIERVDLSAARGPNTVFGQVLAAVDEVAPRPTDADTVLWNWLSNLFAGTRWRGHMDRLLSDGGMSVAVPLYEGSGVPGVAARRSGWLHLRLHAVFGEEMTLAGRTDLLGLIVQDYSYSQRDVTDRHGRAASGDVTGADSDPFTFGGVLSTGRDRGSSGALSEQSTTVRGMASWKGANRVRQPLSVVVEARFVPATNPGPPTRARRVLSGEVVRLMPDGLVQVLTEGAEAPADPPRPGGPVRQPFELSDQPRLDARGVPFGRLIDRLVTVLAHPDLFGTAAESQRWILEHALSPVALSVFLDQIATPAGFSLPALPVPGKIGQYVRLTLRAGLLGESVVVDRRPDGEIRDVHRWQEVAKNGWSVSDLAPFGYTGTAESPPLWEEMVIGGSTAGGEQTGRTGDSASGLRREITRYEKGTVSTFRVAALYEVTATRFTMRRGERVRTTYELTEPVRAEGVVYVTEFDSAEVPVRERVRDWGLRPGGTARRDVLPPAAGTRYPVPLWGPGPPPRPGGTGYSGGFAGGPLAPGFSAADVAVVGGVLAGIGARRGVFIGAPMSARGPPGSGLRSRERLLVVDAAELVSGLVAGGVDPVRAADLVDRLWVFSWRAGAAGIDVIAVRADRLGELVAAGAWAKALAHERRFHLEPGSDRHGHEEDVRRILGMVEGQQSGSSGDPFAVPGGVLASGLAAAGWDWAVAGGAAVAIAGISVAVRLAGVRLALARQRVLAGWAMVPPEALPLPGRPVRADQAVRLLVGAAVHLGRSESTAAELLRSADPGTGAAVAEVAAELLSQMTPDAAHRKALSGAGEALFDEVLPAARTAAGQRAALLVDVGADAAAMLAAAERMVARPDAPMPAPEVGAVARLRAEVDDVVEVLTRADAAPAGLFEAKSAPSGSAGPLAVGGLDAVDTELVHQALMTMRRDRSGAQPDTFVRRAAGLRHDEELFVPRPDELIEQLRQLGVDREHAVDVARRLIGFGWRDEATGVGVIAVLEHRLVQLLQLGLLAEVVEHERLFHMGRRHDPKDHVDHAWPILQRLGMTSAPPGVDAARPPLLPEAVEGWKRSGVARHWGWIGSGREAVQVWLLQLDGVVLTAAEAEALDEVGGRFAIEGGIVVTQEAALRWADDLAAGRPGPDRMTADGVVAAELARLRAERDLRADLASGSPTVRAVAGDLYEIEVNGRAVAQFVPAKPEWIDTEAAFALAQYELAVLLGRPGAVPFTVEAAHESLGRGVVRRAADPGAGDDDAHARAVVVHVLSEAGTSGSDERVRPFVGVGLEYDLGHDVDRVFRNLDLLRTRWREIGLTDATITAALGRLIRVYWNFGIVVKLQRWSRRRTSAQIADSERVAARPPGGGPPAVTPRVLAIGESTANPRPGRGTSRPASVGGIEVPAQLLVPRSASRVVLPSELARMGALGLGWDQAGRCSGLCLVDGLAELGAAGAVFRRGDWLFTAPASIDDPALGAQLRSRLGAGRGIPGAFEPGGRAVGTGPSADPGRRLVVGGHGVEDAVWSARWSARDDLLRVQDIRGAGTLPGFYREVVVRDVDAFEVTGPMRGRIVELWEQLTTEGGVLFVDARGLGGAHRDQLVEVLQDLGAEFARTGSPDRVIAIKNERPDFDRYAGVYLRIRDEIRSALSGRARDRPDAGGAWLADATWWAGSWSVLRGMLAGARRHAEQRYYDYLEGAPLLLDVEPAPRPRDRNRPGSPQGPATARESEEDSPGGLETPSDPPARGSPLPSVAERQAIIDRQITVQGRQFLKKKRKADRDRFVADPEHYVDRNDWVARVRGMALEDLAEPLVRAQAAERGERVYRNVEVELVTVEGRNVRRLMELDYLLVGTAGVRYLSVKTNPDDFTRRKDRADVERLVAGLPADSPVELRAVLDALILDRTAVAATESVTVTWAGLTRSIPLAEFRRVHVGSAAGSVAVELLTPDGLHLGDGHHRVAMTAEEIRSEVIAGIHRRVAALDGPPATGGPAAHGEGEHHGGASWAERNTERESTQLRVPKPATSADLERIRAEAIVNPDGRGIVLVPPGDPLRAHALELRVAPGEVVLVMHGDGDGFVYPTGEADVRVSAAQVAALLEQLLPGPARSGPLTVCACSPAAGHATVARELAQYAGRPVVGSTSQVQVHRPGRAGARVTTDGRWLHVDATGPARVTQPPPALLDPEAAPGAQRLGPAGVRLPIAPRAPPAVAGGDGELERLLTGPNAPPVGRWARILGIEARGVVGRVVALLFGRMTPAQLRASARRVVAISPDAIAEEVTAAGLDEATSARLLEVLLARRVDIADRAGLVLPESHGFSSADDDRSGGISTPDVLAGLTDGPLTVSPDVQVQGWSARGRPGTANTGDRDTGSGRSSGAVFDGEWTAELQQRWETVLEWLDARGALRQRSDITHFAVPGTTVMEIRMGWRVRLELRRAGLAGLQRRLVAYYWARPDDRGQVVIFAPMLRRLRAMGPALLASVLVHEDVFHRQGRAELGELTHAQHNDAIVEQLRARSFRLFSWGRLGADLGMAATTSALPVLAAVQFDASELVVSLFTVLSYGAGAAVGPHAGLLVDRTRKRALLIRLELARAALIASVLVAALTGVLTLGHLYVVTVVGGALFMVTLVASRTYQGFLLQEQYPDVTGWGYRQAANRANTVWSVGPIVGSWLAPPVGAASLLPEVVGRVGSVVNLARIRDPDPAPENPLGWQDVTRWLRQAAARATAVVTFGRFRGDDPAPRAGSERPGPLDGARGLRKHEILRPLAAYEAATKFFSQMFLAAQAVYLLQLSPVKTEALVGLVIGIVGVAVFGGAVLAGRAGPWLTTRFGVMGVLWKLPVAVMPLYPLYPAASAGWLGLVAAGTVLAVLEAVGRIRAPLLNMIVAAAAHREGRAAGAIHAAWLWLTDLLVSPGALTGGLLAVAIGYRPMTVIALVGLAAASILLVRSPVPAIGEIEGVLATAMARMEAVARIPSTDPFLVRNMRSTAVDLHDRVQEVQAAAHPDPDELDALRREAAALKRVATWSQKRLAPQTTAVARLRGLGRTMARVAVPVSPAVPLMAVLGAGGTVAFAAGLAVAHVAARQLAPTLRDGLARGPPPAGALLLGLTGLVGWLTWTGVSAVEALVFAAGLVLPAALSRVTAWVARLRAAAGSSHWLSGLFGPTVLRALAAAPSRWVAAHPRTVRVAVGTAVAVALVLLLDGSASAAVVGTRPDQATQPVMPAVGAAVSALLAVRVVRVAAVIGRRWIGRLRTAVVGLGVARQVAVLGAAPPVDAHTTAVVPTLVLAAVAGVRALGRATPGWVRKVGGWLRSGRGSPLSGSSSRHRPGRRRECWRPGR